MSIDKRAATCDPDNNLVFNRKEDTTKIVKPVWRIALSKVIIEPSPNCDEITFTKGSVEDKSFILAVCKFKIMVITGAYKYVLKRVFKK